jgi:hypothetical protein
MVSDVDRTLRGRVHNLGFDHMESRPCSGCGIQLSASAMRHPHHEATRGGARGAFAGRFKPFRSQLRHPKLTLDRHIIYR